MSSYRLSRRLFVQRRQRVSLDAKCLITRCRAGQGGDPLPRSGGSAARGSHPEPQHGDQ
jgi:hypothetical protein